MPFVIRADVVDEDLNVISCHEFYGDTARDAADNLDEFLQDSKALREAQANDELIIGDVEEISDDEMPEVQEEDEEDEGEAIDAKIVEEK